MGDERHRAICDELTVLITAKISKRSESEGDGMRRAPLLVAAAAGRATVASGSTERAGLTIAAQHAAAIRTAKKGEFRGAEQIHLSLSKNTASTGRRRRGLGATGGERKCIRASDGTNAANTLGVAAAVAPLPSR